MSQPQAVRAPKPKFDNKGQYSRNSILRYEKIFGDHYISTGGAETTDNLCRRLAGSLRKGVRVLDVGSGIGGAAFHLATAFGAQVTGIDLAEEMVAIALDRAEELGMAGKVNFVLGDVLETEFPGRFDIIWSRPAFEEYIEKTGYHVVEPDQYGKLLRGAGFVDVVVDDATATFVDILRRESRRLFDHRAEFLASFSADDLNYLVDRWAMKDRFCQAGDMKWGIYLGTRRD
jgi:phosphoethanolamine N-methyltransferase